MAVRQVVGIVGAAIGAYVGGPSGAQYGWMIGSAIGGIVDPLVINGPKVGEVSQQTSQEGVPRPIVFAVSPPMAGNIIVSGPIKKVVKKTQQGKGGPTVKTTSLFRTYAIGMCEGQINRVLRVWRNGELVWDSRTSTELNYHDFNHNDLFRFIIRTVTNNLVFEDRVKFYFGDFAQNADPHLEAIFGVGTTPAHRGTAYMVVADDDLTDLRGAIPQFLFQVERCEGTYLTSRPYAVEDTDAMGSSGALEREAPHVLPEDAMESSGALISGELRATLESYDEWPPEALESEGSLTGGDIHRVLLEYDEWPPEALESEGSLESGDINRVLITYDEWPTEALNSTGSLESGALS